MSYQMVEMSSGLVSNEMFQSVDPSDEAEAKRWAEHHPEFTYLEDIGYDIAASDGSPR